MQSLFHAFLPTLEYSCLYLPEGLQQDAQLLCPAQCKHRDQHLRAGEADSGGSHWPHYPSLNTASSKMLTIYTLAGRLNDSVQIALLQRDSQTFKNYRVLHTHTHTPHV